MRLLVFLYFFFYSTVFLLSPLPCSFCHTQAHTHRTKHKIYEANILFPSNIVLSKGLRLYAFSTYYVRVCECVSAWPIQHSHSFFFLLGSTWIRYVVRMFIRHLYSIYITIRIHNNTTNIMETCRRFISNRNLFVHSLWILTNKYLLTAQQYYRRIAGLRMYIIFYLGLC